MLTSFGNGPQSPMLGGKSYPLRLFRYLFASSQERPLIIVDHEYYTFKYLISNPSMFKACCKIGTFLSIILSSDKI